MASPDLTAMAILSMDVHGADKKMAGYLKGVEEVHELRMARHLLLSAAGAIEAEIRARGANLITVTFSDDETGSSAT